METFNLKLLTSLHFYCDFIFISCEPQLFLSWYVLLIYLFFFYLITFSSILLHVLMCSAGYSGYQVSLFVSEKEETKKNQVQTRQNKRTENTMDCDSS